MDLLAAACTDEMTWRGVVLVSVALICGTAGYAVHRYTATRYESEPPRGPGKEEHT